ncbi:Wadjet anti-phage system protein JetD domain-containing protein [Brevibacterium sp. LE-L]|uniref:Wadjet anti-phage system protein JetD domain-containing protein n=1 Tax=unclassified Brevibacterium TaxID=2614124 RepID=UPI003CE8A279
MTMLSVAGARTKARARLNSSMAAWAAEGSGVVRLEIALKPPTEKQVLTDQAAAAEWAGSWRAAEETAIGWASPTAPGSVAGTRSGLEIDWEDRNWARVGRQRIPIRVRLTTADAVADFVGGESARDWRRLRDRAATIRDRFAAEPGSVEQIDADDPDGPGAGGTGDDDALAAAIRSQAKRILGLTDAAFTTVLDVVDWLRGHRLGTLRPRQLPIRGVDSKWFETHRSLVTALLGGIGHADAVTVLDAEPRLRLRILDPALRVTAEPAAPATGQAADISLAGLDDITAPISQLGRLPIAPQLVFVFENLESVLAMPAWPAAVAVHGSGYAVDGVARFDWIADARVIYWGDLDSHGFAILNRLRSHLPAVESVLMDEANLLAHRDLWVPEPKPSTGTFAHLTGTELRALDRIRAEGNVRLEQERIPWDTALNRLRTAVGNPTPSRLGEGEGDLGAGTNRGTETERLLGEGDDDDG